MLDSYRPLSDETLKKFKNFFENNKIKTNYTGIEFYSNTINLRNRINVYSQRMVEVDSRGGRCLNLLETHHG